MSAEVRVTSPDDRRTTPGRAIAERFRVEYAVEVLVDEAVNEYLLITHQMAQTMLVSDTVLTAAGEEAMAPFTPSQMTLVWDLAVEHAMRGGFSNVLGILPPRLQSIVRGLYATGQALDFMDDVFSDFLYNATLGLFSRAHEQGLHTRRVEKMLDEVFARALPDGRPSGIQTRAQRMARSAATSTYNRAMLEQLRADGYALKLWVSHHDERVRDSHLHADGVAIPLDDPFRVGDALLAYPGDPSAPIGETINCRCVIVGENGDPTPGIDWDQPVISLSERQRLGYEPGYVVPDEEMPLAASGFSYNPNQARAPKGTPIGGQWIITPSGLLELANPEVPLKPYPGGYADILMENAGNRDLWKVVNPDRDLAGGMVNCASVSISIEMRVRGHNVKAQLDSSHTMFLYRMDEAFQTAEGEPVEFSPRMTSQEALDYMEAAPIGARFIVTGTHKSGRSGHAWNAEVDEGLFEGTMLRETDWQVGTRVAENLKNDVYKDIRVLRVDNLEINLDRVMNGTKEANGTVLDAISVPYDKVQEPEEDLGRPSVFTDPMLRDAWEYMQEQNNLTASGGMSEPLRIAEQFMLDDGRIAFITDPPIVDDCTYVYDPETDEFWRYPPNPEAVVASGSYNYNPDQARAPKGTPIGGQWIYTPGGLLKRLPSEALAQGRLDLGVEIVGDDGLTGSERYFLPNRRSESFLYPVQSYLYDNVATRSLITDEVREFMSEKAAEGVTISMFETGMKGLIREGRLRNAHELADGRRGGFYMAIRDEYEVTNMGTRDSLGSNGLTNPMDRPIYGHAGWDRDVASANGYYYGSFEVRLSPRVLDRTSWTLGDSMDKGARPLWTREIAEGSDEAIFAAAEDVLREFGDHTDPDGSFDVDFGQWRDTIPYVEAQVFGGVTLEDVAEISIPSNYIHSFETEDLQRLVDRGIAVTIDGEYDWDPSVMGFSARTETFAWNPKQARAPKGTPIGGQWIDTPSALLGLFEQTSDRGYAAGHPFTATYPWLKFEDSYGLERDHGAALKMEAQRFVSDMTLDRFNDRVNDYLREGGLPAEDLYDRKVRDYLLKKDTTTPTFLPGEEADAYWNQGALADGDEVTAGLVHAIDTAATYNTINAPVRLFRGVSVDDTRDFEVGMQIRELGYSSTTYESYVANEFANFRAGEPSALDEGTDILRDDEREGIPMVMTMVIAPGTHYVHGVQGIGEVILERDMVYEVVAKNLGGITVMGYPARMVNEEIAAAEVAA